MLCMSKEQLNKKSSLILSSQGMNNSYRPEPMAIRAPRNRSRSNTRDSAFESGGNQLYQRTGSSNGYALSMPNERRRPLSVDPYKNPIRAVSNPNPTIAHTNRETKTRDNWPVREMVHLAPYVVANKFGRVGSRALIHVVKFIYQSEERADKRLIGKIIFEAMENNQVFRIVIVDFAGTSRQKVNFYKPRSTRKPNTDDPPLALGEKENGPCSRLVIEFL